MLAFLLLSLAILAPQAPAQPDTAALVVGARTITVFRGAFGPATPAERVQLAQLRIRQLLGTGADSVGILVLTDGSFISLGHYPAFIITPADVDTLLGETMEGKVEAARQGLTLVMKEYVEARSVRSLLTATLFAALATLLLVVSVRWIRAGVRWVHRRVETVERDTLPRMFPRMARLFHPEGIARPVRAAVTVAGWLLGLSLGYIYATFVLRSFPWTRPAGERLGQVLETVLLNLGRGIRDGIPDLITIVVIVAIASFVGRVLDRVFAAVANRSMTLPGLHPETAEPTRRIAKAMLWLFVLITIYPHLPGSDSAAFKGVSVFAGLLVSFGSAGLAGQVMSGLALMYSRGYRVGDYIRAGEHEGTVQSLGMLMTRLRTVKDEYVNIPNSVVLGGSTVNYSVAGREGHTLLIYTSATIGYDVARTQVESLMLEAARGSEGVVDSPPPFVLMRSLGDYSIEYQLNAAIDASRARELPQLYSTLHCRVFDAFAEAGVEILSPSYFALRDGNRATIPQEIRPDLKPGSFRVRVQPPAG